MKTELIPDKGQLYKKLATLVQARENCASSNNSEWFARHTAEIRRLVESNMPHGSGFDIGTKLDLDASSSEKLVFTTAFHHTNDNGFYDGWTDHKVTITPSLAFGFSVRVSGRDRNDIKDYIAEMFQ